MKVVTNPFYHAEEYDNPDYQKKVYQLIVDLSHAESLLNNILHQIKNGEDIDIKDIGYRTFWTKKSLREATRFLLGLLPYQI